MAGEGHTDQQSTVTLGHKNHKRGILRHMPGGTTPFDIRYDYNNLDVICTSKKYLCYACVHGVPIWGQNQDHSEDSENSENWPQNAHKSALRGWGEAVTWPCSQNRCQLPFPTICTCCLVHCGRNVRRPARFACEMCQRAVAPERRKKES